MAGVRLIGEIASQKGSRPPTFGWFLLIAPITHPSWAWGSNPDPPLDTRVFMHRSGSPVLNSAFVASRADCGSWGGGLVPWGWQPVGSRQTTGRELGPARGWP